MEIPKYIVFRVDVMRKGTSVELTNITDEVEDVILKADRKTEPTISKMEQVDKDINVRSKTELKTQTETQNSNLTFEKRTMRDCYNCRKYETEGECVECHFEPKDEPQSDCPWK